jgi:hypothetical protein
LYLYLYKFTLKPVVFFQKMKAIVKQTKQILVQLVLLFCVTSAGAQVKHPQALTQVKKKPVSVGQVKKKAVPVSAQFKEFSLLLAQASIAFTFPKGFKEIPAVNNEDFSFDYAMEMPGKDFEVWFQVKSQKENWASYERSQNDSNRQLANPDSLYVEMGKAHAAAFTGDRNYFIRNMPQNVLTRYNADSGKSYLLNLLDLPATKHYKYALLITLQRNHTGTVMMVCFTNEKDPEFFKNIDKATNCLKFKS